MKHLVLLRGINVGGNKIIRMEALRLALEDAGFLGVKTFIQSGNIILESDGSGKNVAQKVRKVIEMQFGFEVSAIATDADSLKATLDNNPFNDTDQVYIAFFDDDPQADKIIEWKAADHTKDLTVLVNKAMFVKYGESAGKSKLTNALIEKKLGVVSTMRNWKTSMKLLELLK